MYIQSCKVTLYLCFPYRGRWYNYILLADVYHSNTIQRWSPSTQLISKNRLQCNSARQQQSIIFKWQLCYILDFLSHLSFVSSLQFFNIPEDVQKQKGKKWKKKKKKTEEKRYNIIKNSMEKSRWTIN